MINEPGDSIEEISLMQRTSRNGADLPSNIFLPGPIEPKVTYTFDELIDLLERHVNQITSAKHGSDSFSNNFVSDQWINILKHEVFGRLIQTYVGIESLNDPKNPWNIALLELATSASGIQVKILCIDSLESYIALDENGGLWKLPYTTIRELDILTIKGNLTFERLQQEELDSLLVLDFLKLNFYKCLRTLGRDLNKNQTNQIILPSKIVKGVAVYCRVKALLNGDYYSELFDLLEEEQ